MRDIFTAFRAGAMQLAMGDAYGELHRQYGLMEADWALLTTEEHWTPDESRRVRSILASVIEVALTISGMPAVPLPGQYAAAVIACVVSPANRLVACMKVPDTFDAVAASGLFDKFEVRRTPPEQMIALVVAYSGGLGGEPPADRLPVDINDIVRKEDAK